MRALLTRGLACALLLVGAAALADDMPPALAEMAAAERQFAATAGVKGIRDAFLEFFTDDVITFSPTDIRHGKAHLQAQPPSTGSAGPKLTWEPVYGDVARSGDLGYLTGPFTFTSPQGEQQHGMYFSVWKRQPAGGVKVVLDAGIPTNDALPRGNFQRAPKLQPPTAGGASGSAAQAEQSFAAAAASSQRDAFSRFASRSLRVHRAGAQPFTGYESASAQFSAAPVTYEAADSGVSRANDLAWVVGRYRSAQENGLYVRIWQKQRGRWYITFDSMSPAPKS